MIIMIMIIMSHKAENVNIQCNGLTSLDYSLFSNWVLFRGTKKAIEWWWVCHQYFKIKRFCRLQTCLLLTRLYEELIASVVPRSQLKMGSHWLRSDFLCVITTFIIINDNHINHHHRHHEYRSEHWASHRCANFLRLCVGEHCCEQPGIFSSFIFGDFFIFLPLYIDISILLWTAWWQWQCAIASVGHLVFLFLICYIWHFCLKFHYKVGILTSAISKSCPLTRLQWPSFDPLRYFTKKIK